MFGAVLWTSTEPELDWDEISWHFTFADNENKSPVLNIEKFSKYGCQLVPKCCYGHSFRVCEPGCRRLHNALAHDELSERIISATTVSKGGGRHSAALNRGERVGGRGRKSTESHRWTTEKRRKCPLQRADFSRAPMLEHSSELALVQSLYANSMRCPPSAAGISVRNEDLPMRYVGVGPLFKFGRAFCGATRAWTASLSELDIVTGCIVSKLRCSHMMTKRVCWLWEVLLLFTSHLPLTRAIRCKKKKVVLALQRCHVLTFTSSHRLKAHILLRNASRDRRMKVSVFVAQPTDSSLWNLAPAENSLYKNNRNVSTIFETQRPNIDMHQDICMSQL